MPRRSAIIPVDYVQQRIFHLRGRRVILAGDLARMYGVPVKRLNEQVKRNADRFPEDFVFQLTSDEAQSILKSQIATSSAGMTEEFSRSQIATLKSDLRGSNQKYRPYAFTEHGVLMAANVLRSKRASKASVFIVRAFVKLRELLATHHQLAEKLAELERRLQDHDGQILAIMDAIQQIMESPEEDPPKPPVGFHTEALGPTKLQERKRLKAR